MNLPGALFLLAVLAAVAAGPSSAFAQATEPGRPSNGLFFGDRSDQDTGHKLDITLTSTEGYFNDGSSEPRAALGGDVQEPTGYSTMLLGAANYAWHGRRTQVWATGLSTLRYYRPLGDIASNRSASHTAGLGFSVRSTKTGVTVNQTAAYLSSPLYDLFAGSEAVAPGEAPPAAPDYATTDSETYSYGTGITFTRELTRRNRVSSTVDWQHTNTLGGIAGTSELNMYGTRTTFSRRLARNTTATAGYLYRIGDVGYGTEARPGQIVTEHGVDMGVDYRWPLSATRYLTIGARLGAWTMMLPESVEGAATSVEGAVIPLEGAAIPVEGAAIPVEGAARNDRRYGQSSAQLTMAYEFGRTWLARASYRRGVEYLAGLSEPVSANSFTTSIDGLLTRRVDVLASAAYSSGESAVNRSGSVFAASTGDVRLRYAVTRAFAAYIEYLYYFYDSRGSLPLVPGIPSSLERKGVRAGLMLRVPTLRR